MSQIIFHNKFGFKAKNIQLEYKVYLTILKVVKTSLEKEIQFN